MVTRKAFGTEFVGAEGFLDTPTYGLPPRFVAEALLDATRSWEQGRLELDAFDEPMRASRAAYASLIGVDEHHVAMGTSVSSLIGLVASSLPDGSRVATLHGEFTSVTFPFAAQAERGITVTELPRGHLENAVGDFDAVAANLVQSADGAVLDVETLRQAAAESGTVTWPARCRLDVIERANAGGFGPAPGESVCRRGPMVVAIWFAAAFGCRGWRRWIGTR